MLPWDIKVEGVLETAIFRLTIRKHPSQKSCTKSNIAIKVTTEYVELER